MLEQLLLRYYHQRIQEDQAAHDLLALPVLPVVQKHLESLVHLLYLKNIPSYTKHVSVMLFVTINADLWYAADGPVYCNSQNIKVLRIKSNFYFVLF